MRVQLKAGIDGPRCARLCKEGVNPKWLQSKASRISSRRWIPNNSTALPDRAVDLANVEKPVWSKSDKGAASSNQATLHVKAEKPR